MSYNGAPVYDKMEHNGPNDTTRFSQAPRNVEHMNNAAYHWQRVRWFCHQVQHAIDHNEVLAKKMHVTSPEEIPGSHSGIRQMVPQTPEDASFVRASQNNQSAMDEALSKAPQPDAKRDVEKPTTDSSDSKLFKCNWCGKGFKENGIWNNTWRSIGDQRVRAS